MLGVMATGKALTPERNDRLRAMVRDWVAKQFKGNVTKAASRVGVSQALLSEFLSGGRGAGPKLLEGLADAMGRSVDDLLGRRAMAAVPSSSVGASPILAARESAIVEVLADYPDDAYVNEAIAEVRTMQFRTKRELDKAWFVRAILRHATELRALDK